MKKLFLLIALLASSAGAQSVTQVFVTNVPAIAPAIDLTRVFVDTHTLQWRVTGSASACSVQIDGSSDGINWTAGSVIASQTCTANGQFSQASTITNYARIDVTALNGASVNFLYVASSSVVAAGFSTTVPHTWGPGALGTGAAQTFTHPSDSTSNKYSEITVTGLQGNPTLDRNLFNICDTGCAHGVHFGMDNDFFTVISWPSNSAVAVVGAQNESAPWRWIGPVLFDAGINQEFQASTLANSCPFFNSCKNGNWTQVALNDTGIKVLACVSNWDSTNFIILGSCEPNTVYNAVGAIQNNEATHIVQDTATLVAGAVTVTLTAPAAFQSATSFTCTANDQTAANAVRVTQTSGTSVTFNGTGTDVVRFICVGA